MMGKALSGELSCPCDRSCFIRKAMKKYSRLFSAVVLIGLRFKHMYISAVLSRRVEDISKQMESQRKDQERNFRLVYD